MSEFLKLLATSKGGKAILATPSAIMLFGFVWLAIQVTEIKERLVRIETRFEFYDRQNRAASNQAAKAGEI